MTFYEGLLRKHKHKSSTWVFQPHVHQVADAGSTVALTSENPQDEQVTTRAGEDAAEDSDLLEDGPTVTTTMVMGLQDSSTTPKYRRRRMTREEALDQYIYGPRDDPWRPPPYKHDLREPVEIRMNRATEMRRSHIIRRAEDRIACEEAELRNDSYLLEREDLMQRKREFRRRKREATAPTTPLTEATTSDPEDPSRSSTAQLMALSNREGTTGRTTLTTEEPTVDDDTDSTENPSEDGSTTTSGTPGTAESTTATSATSVSETSSTSTAATSTGYTSVGPTDGDTTTCLSTPCPDISTEAGAGDTRTPSSTVSSFSYDSGRARDIPQTTYQPPRIEVRENKSSKFRYLYNRRPEGVKLYFREMRVTKKSSRSPSLSPSSSPAKSIKQSSKRKLRRSNSKKKTKRHAALKARKLDFRPPFILAAPPACYP